MPRKPRENTEGKYYHVMVQGIGKEYIFPDDNCKGYFLASLQKAKLIKGINILAFCIMGNHAHVLVVSENNNALGQFFKRANAEYAMYYNRQNNRVGYVFRDRFKSESITDEKYLINCLVYIHNNPVKAGLIERAEDYKYSSYINYISKKGIIDFEEAKKYYSINEGDIRAIMQEKTYANWLEHDDKEYENREIVFDELIKRYGLTRNMIKGNDEVLYKIVNEIQKRCKVSLREIAAMLGIARETLRKKVGSLPPSP
jgi:REP element-mobilizing transposase RayT